MGTASSMTDSAVATATYAIDVNATPAAAPTFSPAGGSYSTAQSVTLLTATTGASLYYTTEGSTPTTASTLYSAPVAPAPPVRLAFLQHLDDEVRRQHGEHVRASVR
jgi:hypothetical protein